MIIFLARVFLIPKFYGKILWKYVIEVYKGMYIRCKFCNQRCSRGVNRLKNHLTGTHHGMKPCSKVNEDVGLECKITLTNFKE